MNQAHGAILVVDDDPETCRNLSDIFSDRGYRVQTAQDGVSALALVQHNFFDLALLDLKMPGMGGIELYREIKKLSAGTVAIIVTAYASRTTTEEALAAGAWHVLSKPTDISWLLTLVDRALDQPLLLVVDDDQALCSTLWDLLRERGFRVCLAFDMADASHLLKDRSFHVVLIDLKLPDGDGGQIFRLVRQNYSQTRSILITGFPTEMADVVEQALAQGADAVCYKPFDVPVLLSTLEKLIVAKKGASITCRGVP